MTRSKPLTVILLTGAAMLVFNGCHTTVVQPVERPDAQQDHRDDHHDDRDHPPPPPDHQDDHR